MGAFNVVPTPSLHDVVRSTSNSIQEEPGAQGSLIFGRSAGSPDESNTKTQQPDAAFFRNRRALNTSLWKI